MRNISRRTPWIHLLNALCFLLISSGLLIRWKFTVLCNPSLNSTVLLAVCIALACVSFTKLKET